MVSYMSSRNLSEFPTDLVRAVESQASQEAALVAQFLDRWAPTVFSATGLQPTVLPGSFLLAMGCVFRIAIWEAEGIVRHLECGLPTRDIALILAMSFLVNTAQEPEHRKTAERLQDQVLQFFIGFLAWTGPQEMGGDVVLGALEDDRVLDQIAVFLWTHRHDLENKTDIRSPGTLS